MTSPATLLIEKLTVHPLLAPVPRLALDSPEMAALIRSVETHGFLRPVIVNDRDEIMDGRCLVLAAEKIGRSAVDCLVRPDEDAATIILDTLCARRHLTKSALAYLAFPIMEAASEAREAARIRGLMAGKNHRKATQLLSGKISIEETAVQLGFSREYFYKSRQVHALFAEQPAFKAQMEPLLLSSDERDQVSLQGVLAGWTGKQNEGQPRRQADQLDLFDDAFRTLRYHLSRTWGSIDPERRAALAPQVRETVAVMPPEVRELFAREIKEANRAAKEVPA
jgi:hypothetical protein